MIEDYILPAIFFGIGMTICVVLGAWYILAWMRGGDGIKKSIINALRAFFSTRLLRMLYNLVTNAIYFRKMTRVNLTRGLIKSAFLISYLGVILINHFLAEIWPKYGPHDLISVFLYAPFLPYYLFKVTNFATEPTTLYKLYAFLDNFFMLVIILGEIYFLYRKFIKKIFPIYSVLEDGLAIALTVVWLLLRIFGESVTLLVDNVPDAAAKYWILAYPVSKIIAPLGASVEALEYPVWSAAGFMLGAFMAAIPLLPKLWHIFAGPVTVVTTASAPASHCVTEKKTGFTTRQMMEIDGCLSCGLCLEACTLYRVTNNPYNVYYGINKLLKGINRKTYGVIATLTGKPRVSKEEYKKLMEGVFTCLLCGRCHEFCPVFIDTTLLGISTREHVISKGLLPERFKMVSDTLEKNKNVLGMPNEDRGMWADYLMEPPEVMSKDAEVVYFVGCMASFSPAVQDIPMAVADIFTAAGVKYTILGGEEWCCGYPMIVAGLKDKARELIEHNKEVIKKLGVKTVVFSCPSCYLTWKNEYHLEEEGIQLMHHTQFINKLIKEGRLKLKEQKVKVTYHDPCDLGRKMNEFEAPREILRSLPGVEFVEMRYNKRLSMCCGGGGDVEMLDENLPPKVGVSVIEEAEKTGAEILATACQQCKRTLMKAAKEKGSKIKVVDIAELVQRALEM